MSLVTNPEWFYNRSSRFFPISFVFGSADTKKNAD
jgi:hypothetical protein